MYCKKPDDLTQLVQLIKSKNGNKSEVCKAFGISRQTLNNWEELHTEIKEAFEEAREEFLDFAESRAKMLIEGIPIVEIDKATGKKVIIGWKERPDTRMITYVLGHLGYNRGYIPKQHLDITSNGKDINATTQIYIMPDGTQIKF